MSEASNVLINTNTDINELPITASDFIDTSCITLGDNGLVLTGYNLVPEDEIEEDETTYVWEKMYTKNGDGKMSYPCISLQDSPGHWYLDTLPPNSYTLCYLSEHLYIVCNSDHHIIRVVYTCNAWSDCFVLYEIKDGDIVKISELYHNNREIAIYSDGKCINVIGSEYIKHPRRKGDPAPMLNDII